MNDGHLWGQLNQKWIAAIQEMNTGPGDEYLIHKKNIITQNFNWLCSFGSKESERLHLLEEEQEQLNSSLMALTSHFAQVQFRLKQIVDADSESKEHLLRELEEFAFRGTRRTPTNVIPSL